MSVTVVRVDDEQLVIRVAGELDAAELLALVRENAASASRFVIDVTRSPQISPVALAMLKASELWPRITLWGLSYQADRHDSEVEPGAVAAHEREPTQPRPLRSLRPLRPG